MIHDEPRMRLALASLIVPIAVLAACGRKGARSSDFDSATAAALAAGVPAGSTGAAPSGTAARASGFDFGHRIDRNGRIEGGVSSQFGPGDSILISVRAMSAQPGTDVSVRLRFNGKTIDSAGNKAGAADSTGVAFVPFGFGSAKPRTPGTYQADVFVNGKFQMSQDFKVGP